MPLWLRSALFTVCVPGTVAGFVPCALATSSWRIPLDLGALRWLGAVPLALGILVYVATAWQFVVEGRGTPGPWDPPEELVRSGLHAWVRNPMYIGVLLVILGEALLWQSGALVAYFIAIWTVFHLRVLWYEEPTLQRSFGAAFDAYRARVPRWIPRRPVRCTPPVGA